MVVKQPKFTRVEEPTLLCNHLDGGDKRAVVCLAGNLDFDRRVLLFQIPSAPRAEPDFHSAFRGIKGLFV